jgi:hypothetical protein
LKPSPRGCLRRRLRFSDEFFQWLVQSLSLQILLTNHALMIDHMNPGPRADIPGSGIRSARAEPLLLAGYEGIKKREAKIPAQSKIRLTDALERLVQLYEAMDKKAEAATWRKELEAIKTAQKKLHESLPKSK